MHWTDKETTQLLNMAGQSFRHIRVADNSYTKYAKMQELTAVSDL